MKFGSLLEILVVVIVAVVVVGFGQMLGGEERVAVLGGNSFLLEIADDNAERTQGLSGRLGLEPNKGMLFVFERPELGCFWMKDMKLNIDILWFDATKQLVFDKSDVSPASYPEVFCAPQNAKYVLELKAGTARRLGLQAGDTLKLL